MIEIRKPNVQQPLPREQGVMLVTGQETIHISRKGNETKQFYPKENVY